MAELQGLQSRVGEFRGRGADIIAISVDPVEQNADVATKLGLSYRVLSDPELHAIDAFGVRHAAAGIDGHDIARPATFVIDEQGIIRWRNLTADYRIRGGVHTVASREYRRQGKRGSASSSPPRR